MLGHILAAFKTYDIPLSLTMLSKHLEIEPSVLEGMLLTLERKGRIVEMCGEDMLDRCHDCPLHRSCGPQEKLYQLADYAKNPRNVIQ